MRILVLNGSPHLDGNTSHLVKSFKEGAESKGHEVEVINLVSKHIAPCEGCERCHKGIVPNCHQEDDMLEIYPKLKHLDMLVFASPIHYYGFSGLMQSCISRFYSPYKLTSIPYFGLILSSNRTEVFDPVIAQYRGIVSFFEGTDKGIVTVHGDDNGQEHVKIKLYNFGAGL